MIRAESASAACSECGENPKQGVVAVTLGNTTTVLCQACGDCAATAIQDNLWRLVHSVASTRGEVTAQEVASFATYPLGLLLDELVRCTVSYHVGPLDADKRRIATALLERLAVLGIARKVHRVGCEIWPEHRLCGCPWEVSA